MCLAGFGFKEAGTDSFMKKEGAPKPHAFSLPPPASGPGSTDPWRERKSPSVTPQIRSPTVRHRFHIYRAAWSAGTPCKHPEPLLTSV